VQVKTQEITRILTAEKKTQRQRKLLGVEDEIETKNRVRREVPERIG
jgi:hypothetical protein